MSSAERGRLIDERGTERVPAHPALVGGRCPCGHVFFPMQTHGCEQCGRHGDDLRPVLLSGRGTLRAFAQVHLHPRPDPKVPFTVGVIALDDGPVVTALLDPPVDPGLRHGVTVVAKLVSEESEARTRPAVRFARADSEGA
jgi:uncharacterized OB-fold protein